MGANVIRLARTDHRRIRELIDRLTRRYRAGETLPARVLGELCAHVEASATALLPFAESRITALDPAYAATLDELAAVADELAEAPRPVPPELTDRLAAAIGRHVEIEEQAILQPLDDEVGVERLRMLGEHFRRCRDARLKAKGNARRRNHRPPASRAELYERARIRGIEGRSTMSRSELLHALREAQ